MEEEHRQNSNILSLIVVKKEKEKGGKFRTKNTYTIGTNPSVFVRKNWEKK